MDARPSRMALPWYIIFVLLCACGNPDAGADATLPLVTVDRDMAVDELLPLVDMTTLQEDSSHAIGGIADAVVHTSGRLFLADYLARELKAFDREGRFLGVLGREGQGPGEYAGPLSVALTPSGERLLLGDLLLKRVLVFDPQTLAALDTRPVHTPLSISFHSVAAGRGDTLLIAGATAYLPSGEVPYHAAALAGDSLVRPLVPGSPEHLGKQLTSNLLAARLDQTDRHAFAFVSGARLLWRLTLGGVPTDSLLLPADVYDGVVFPEAGEWEGGIKELQEFTKAEDWLSSIVAVDDTTTLLQRMRYAEQEDDWVNDLILVRWGPQPRVWRTAPCGCELLASRGDTLALLRGGPPGGAYRVEWRLVPSRP